MSATATVAGLYVYPLKGGAAVPLAETEVTALGFRFDRRWAVVGPTGRVLTQREHPKLARVIYPGLPSHPQFELAQRQMGTGGTLLAVELAGGQAAAFRMLDALGIVLISNNLGDAKSIATHPATTTHQRLPEAQKAALGITPGLVRLSAGLEDPDDLIADLHRALDTA